MKNAQSRLVAVLGIVSCLGAPSAFAGSEYKELPTVTVTAKKKNRSADESGIWSRLLSSLLASGNGGGNRGGGGTQKGGSSGKDPRAFKDVEKECADYAKALEPFMTQNPLRDMSEKIAQDADVIFLGEHHKDKKAKSHYPDIFAQLKAQHQADCVAFEKLPPHLFKTFGSTSRAFCSNIDIYKDLSDWDRAAAAAFCLGMKVYSLDAPFDPRWDCDDDEMEVRNNFISGALHALVQSKSCKKVIMINGNLHLVQNVPGVLEHIPSKLNTMGLKTHTVFVASGTGMRINHQLVPPMCLDLFKSKSAVVDAKQSKDMFDWEWSYDEERDEFIKNNSTFLIFKE